jgi:hypothetical protein
MKVAVVNCAADALCSRFQVKGVPSIKLFLPSLGEKSGADLHLSDEPIGKLTL